MGQFLKVAQAQLGENLAEEVFDGLHVVLRRRLQLGQPCHVLIVEARDSTSECGNGLGFQSRHTTDAVPSEGDEPLCLHVEASVVQRDLGEGFGEISHQVGVSTIERAQSGQRRGGHR